ncbi:MAG: hypothetical protein KDJ62_01275 [Rhodobiaceae bacterium]|nr:hypothetical protein [Rhodobiaceae bacterium]MCC0047889.1 hypothetical protein [Rhodobiaceae bacterium]
MTKQQRRLYRTAGISTAPTKQALKLRKRMVMTWAALAGFAAAAAVSTLLGGGNDNESMITAELPAQQMPAYDGSPMVTGSTGAAGNTQIASLKAEITQLRTAVRRGEIEKKALLKRIAEMRGDSHDPVDDMVTGSLPKAVGGTNAPGSGIAATRTPFPQAPAPMNADAPDVRMHEALSRSMAAELAYAQTKVTETQFAVEVASGQTLAALRNQWNGLSQSHPALLKDFDPVINVREDNRGLSLHLLAGPVRNAADAVDICAQLRDTGTVCAAVPYDGQRLLGAR